MNKAHPMNNTDKLATTTSWFRTAAPYIHAHRGATFVIAFDGETIDSDGFDPLLHDIAILSSLGIKLVLLYGARPQIEAQCEQQGIAVRYHRGLRITDDGSLKVAQAVIGKLRLDIESKLSFGLPNTSANISISQVLHSAIFCRNFMKSIVDQGAGLPGPAPAPVQIDLSRCTREKTGRLLLQGFFDDGKIRGVSPDGRVFEHCISHHLVRQFMRGIRTIDLKGFLPLK